MTKKLQLKKLCFKPVVFKETLQVVFFMVLSSLTLFGQTSGFPEVTARFANPVLDCETNTYCVDVEYRSSTEVDREVFNTNVRFYYNDQVMEFVDFRDFQGGYGILNSNPVETSISSFASLFGFNNGEVLDYVNIAVGLLDNSADPVLLPTDGSWAKLFQVCFEIDPIQIDDLSSFCPSLIWDLEQDPAQGGYMTGPISQGMVITLVGDNFSDPAAEMVEQYNWQYIGNGTPPFGEPNPTVCVDAVCQVEPVEDLPAFTPFSKVLFGLVILGGILFFMNSRYGAWLKI